MGSTISQIVKIFFTTSYQIIGQREKTNFIEIESKLQNMESPFIWGMDEFSNEKEDTGYEPAYEEDLIPLLKLFRIVMRILEETKAGTRDVKLILSELEKCNELLREIEIDKSSLNLSYDVVVNIVMVFECFVYVKFNMGEKAQNLFETITAIDLSLEFEKSTLEGLKGICWSQYIERGSTAAVAHMEKALIFLDECAIFHFVLAKNLRQIRRQTGIIRIPTTQECFSFEQAYALAPNNLVYGLFLAQNYRERKESRIRTLTLHEEVLGKLGMQQYNQYHNHMILKLYLGFIRLFEFESAKECLNRVEKSMENDCMFLHYKGIFYLKQRKFIEGASYMEKAALMGDFCAAKGYVTCMTKYDSAYDCTQFLMAFLERTKNLNSKKRQNILCDVAMSHKKHRREAESIKCYLEAIEIDPDCEQLKYFIPAVDPMQSLNIFQVIQKEFSGLAVLYDENTESAIKKLEIYCKEHFRRERERE